ALEPPDLPLSPYPRKTWTFRNSVRAAGVESQGGTGGVGPVSKGPGAGEIAMAAGEFALRSAEALAGGASLEHGLVEQCRRGDAQAFARLVALHEGMVFNLAARLLGDPEEARDAAQEVFLQVYRTLGRFEGRSTLKTWIYRIVVNQCRNRRRWWRRRRKDRSRSLETLTRSEEERLDEGSGRMDVRGVWPSAVCNVAARG